MSVLPPLRMAYSILAGPVLWAAHFLAVYGMAEFGCRANFSNLAFFTPDGIRIAVLALTVLALVLVGVGGLFAYQGWTALQLHTAQPDSSMRERDRFLLMLGLLFSVLFLFIIAVTALPAVVLNVCDQVI